MLVMLLGAAGRHNHGFERPSLDGFAELLARALPQQYFSRVGIGVAGGGYIGGSLPDGKGAQPGGDCADERAAAGRMHHRPIINGSRLIRAMNRVGVLGFLHESNTFLPVPTTY